MLTLTEYSGKVVFLMRLDPDCIRDVLMAVEEVSNINTVVSISHDNYQKYEKLKKYEYDTVAYHLRQCDLGGYLYHCSCTLRMDFIIMDLTPKAHEFLANIRDNTFWNKVKRKAAELGTTSLEMIPQIATAMLQAKLSGLIG